MSTAYFVSDLHFGLQDKKSEDKKERIFVSFLQSLQGRAERLFIVGDLFDYWFEYRRVYQRGYFRTFTALQDLTLSGTQIHYFIGNHDFMHRDFFQKELGTMLHPESLEITLDEKRFYIAHGDGLVANDFGYLVLKKVLRNKYTQLMYSFLHPDFGIWLASKSSQTSRDYTATKDYGETDSLFEVAKKKIQSGYDCVVFGHSHRRRIENVGKGTYLNLGSWLEAPCFGKYENNELTIEDLK